MSLRTMIMKRILTISLFFVLLASCQEQSGRGNFVIGGSDNLADTCGPDFFYDIPTLARCVSACEEGTREATAEEIAALQTTLTADQVEILNGAKGACVTEVITPSRPTNAIQVNSNYCVCQNKKPVNLDSDPSCVSTCSSKENTTPIIFGSVTPNLEVIDGFTNLQGWCTQAIAGVDTTEPQCSLVADDGTTIDVTTSGNNFQAPLNILEFDKQYVLRIVETSTGSDAQTSAIQVLIKQDLDDVSDKFITFQQISMYSCVTPLIETDTTGRDLFADAAISHFYYRPNNPPPAIPAGFENDIFCHDKNDSSQSIRDDENYPRLQLRQKQFALWNKDDPKMFLENGTLYVNTLIKTDYQNKTGEALTLDIFSPLTLQIAPEVGNLTNLNQNLGYIMIPFVDENGIGVCPGVSEFNGTNALYQVLKDYVQNPTEAIYLAQGPTESLEDSQGEVTQIDPDVMIVRQSEVEPLWFYLNNGIPTAATESSMRNHATYFYWPPKSGQDPFTRTGSQKRYSIRYFDELTSGSGGGIGTSIPEGRRPNDKRIACVIKTN